MAATPKRPKDGEPRKERVERPVKEETLDRRAPGKGKPGRDKPALGEEKSRPEDTGRSGA